MSQNADIVIRHSLPPQKILNLPVFLSEISHPELSGEWTWHSPDMNLDFLIDSWRATWDQPVNSGYLPMLMSENYSLFFGDEDIMTLGTYIRWYKLGDESILNNVIKLAQDFSSLFGATDAIIIPEGLLYEDHVTMDFIRQKAIAEKVKIYEVPRPSL